MDYKYLKLCAFFIFFIGLTSLKAQQASPASGGIISGNDGSISYSIGQTFFTIVGESNGSISEGVQQPNEISEISVSENALLNIQCLPNPTIDFIVLKIGNNIVLDLNYSLSDFTGRILENTKVTSEETIIRMEHLTPSIYFLKISARNKEYNVFKIVKN